MNLKQNRVIIVSALVGVIAILLSIAVISSDTSPAKVNASNVEKVSPTPGGILRPQSEVSVDLKDGFTGRLYINDELVPDDQLEIVESFGQLTFRPGKGKIVEIFEAGQHSARIVYWQSDRPEPPQPQSYTWNFKVTS